MKKIIGLLWLCCVVFIGTTLNAQYYNGDVPTGGPKRRTTKVGEGDLHVRWYPLGLINFYDLNLTFGTEYSYAKNKSVILDAGYIMASVYGNETGELQPASGILFKTAHRWYYGKRRNPMFVDAETGFKAARYKTENQWVSRGVVGGVPAYEELITLTSRKDVFFLGARMGKRVTFSPTSPVGMEFWWGFGIRYRHYYPDLPDDSQVLQNRFWFFNPLNYDESWMPDFQMGVRLTFLTGSHKTF